ncbi:MAG TPA: hypothetical protein VF797_17995 [Noviherbaspirillum sp.]
MQRGVAGIVALTRIGAVIEQCVNYLWRAAGGRIDQRRSLLPGTGIDVGTGLGKQIHAFQMPQNGQRMQQHRVFPCELPPVRAGQKRCRDGSWILLPQCCVQAVLFFRFRGRAFLRR